MNYEFIDNLIKKETKRQSEGLVMIPSENMPSKKVLDIMASPLNNKYSEGYPKKRYYTGNVVIDEIESFAIEQAKKLFKAAHANVQPHSGSNANFAALNAVLNIGDKILSMDLKHGGHLTHGLNINFSGKMFNVVHYGVDEKTQQPDYDAIKKLAEKENPKLIISGASSYPREIDFEKITEIAHSVGAIHLADISHVAGLVIAGLHKNAESADIVTTTTHKTLRGPRGAIILCKEKYAEQIDKSVFPGFQGGPFEHIIAAKAANFIEAQTPEFKEYQNQVVKNAKTLAQVFLENKFKLVTGGTDTHMILMDLSDRNYNGHIAAKALENALIYTNKNVIPFDTGSSFYPSGLRLGTPYLTSRGMKEKEMEIIGGWIVKILQNVENKTLQEKTKEDVITLTKQFPIYEEFLK